jgi:hypothetical protein
MRVGAGFSQVPDSWTIVATSVGGVSQVDAMGQTRCCRARSFGLRNGQPSRSLVGACQTVLDERWLVHHGMLLRWTLRVAGLAAVVVVVWRRECRLGLFASSYGE